MADLERKLLIVGCSNSAGSEIDGTMDSQYNRDHSFGNMLATEHLDRTPINLGVGGLSNQGIARTAMKWINSEYDANAHDLMVLVAWSEVTRMESPCEDALRDYSHGAEFAERQYHMNNLYHQINMGWSGDTDEEKEFFGKYQEFMGHNVKYLQTMGAVHVLWLQNYFKANGIKYLMCNTMNMFEPGPHLSIYSRNIDTDYYYNAFDDTKAFYWYYRNMGYNNPKAQYWHHDEEPHRLYAQELANFYLKT